MLKACFWFIGLLAMDAVSETVPEIRKLTLSNGVLEVGVSPDIGGRILHASLEGMPNMLAVDQDLINAGKPEVALATRHRGYMGHVVWHGPQSQWWTQQTLHKQRKVNQAVWPPDPFTVFATSQILEQNPQQVSLLSETSPVTGLQVNKQFTLNSENRNSLVLDVAAVNKRETQAVDWDIWFNTRVPGDSTVFVPIDGEHNLRFQAAFNAATQEDIHYSVRDGLLSLDKQPASTPSKKRVGKLYVYPSQGWMAAFNNGQLLLIQFDRVAQQKIHPEQGLVELYWEYPGHDYSKGIVEMEVHSALHHLNPNHSMAAQERWTIIRYEGDTNEKSQRAFLKEQLQRLQL
ncbi:uncharacterized protein DUF4380 [Alteromonadaceae bacterium 2753L.S.0a.02]|nr:uncharacterized protein DUF4380 [Alteromonadaceae bacterium 2753L.S.0a.02]